MDSGTERTTVRVAIYNQPYTLAVNGEPAEVEALAHSVDQIMTDIAQQAGNVDGNQVADASGYTNLERYLGWLVGEFKLESAKAE